MVSTVRLLNPKSQKSWQQPNHMTSLHLLSLVDPNFTWFSKWTISAFGRTHLVAALGNSTVLTLIGNTFATYLYSTLAKCTTAYACVCVSCSDVETHDVVVTDVFEEETEGILSTNTGSVISANDLEYVSFLNCIRVLAKLAMCKMGRDSWNISVVCDLSIFGLVSFGKNT
ncbi:hypothetical protein HK096_001395, partial [Nowakowskiella sp. JEL0078]